MKYTALFIERLYLLVGYVIKYICRGVNNTVLLLIKFILWINTKPGFQAIPRQLNWVPLRAGRNSANTLCRSHSHSSKTVLPFPE